MRAWLRSSLEEQNSVAMTGFALLRALDELPQGHGVFSVEVELAVVSSWARSTASRPETVWTRFQVLPPEGGELATGRQMPVDLSEGAQTSTVVRIDVGAQPGSGG